MASTTGLSPTYLLGDDSNMTTIVTFSPSSSSLAATTSAYMNMTTPHNTSGLNTTMYRGSTPYEQWIIIILVILAGFTSLSTVLGNILVVAAFILERNIRQPSNYLIASLAVCDILIGTFSMPGYTMYLLMGWHIGQVACDLWLSLDYTVCLVSQYLVFLITLDRFCSVKAPAKYRNWRTKRKIKMMIAVTWMVPALIFFTSIMGWNKFVGQEPKNDGTCEAQFQSNGLFTAILVISYYWVTLVIMIGLYIGIYKVALSLHMKAQDKRRRIKNMRNLTSEKADEESKPLHTNNGHNDTGNGAINGGIQLTQTSRFNGRQDRTDSFLTAAQRQTSREADSDFSNEASTDSSGTQQRGLTAEQERNSLTASTSLGDNAESPVWKPREALPKNSINWDAFKKARNGENQNAENSYPDTEDLTDKEEESVASKPVSGFTRRMRNILSHMHQMKMRKQANNSPRTKSKSENRAKKALRTITFILGAFVICWTPYHVVSLMYAFCKKEEGCVNNKFYEFSYWLCYMNSPLNPFCYALANQQFKKAFIKILKCEHIKNARCVKGRL